MKTCKNCKIDKNDTDFKKSHKSKDGLRLNCIDCEKKLKSKKTVKYRKTKMLINPEHPIPLKKVGENGFAGKWDFNIDSLIGDIKKFALDNGIINPLKNYPTYQVKNKNKDLMIEFVNKINMSVNGIIFIEREKENIDKQTYVVNLIHRDIFNRLNLI